MLNASSLSDFWVYEEVGRGTYGIVNKCKHKATNQLCAVKAVTMSNLSPYEQTSVFREVQVLKTLDHPHIIQFYGVFTECGVLYLVMEYAHKGDLQKFIHSNQLRNEMISEKQVWEWTSQLVEALQYLHSKNIVHRDIKCMNILLTKEYAIKLGDLGGSAILTKQGLGTSRVGTPLYLAPEQIRQVPHTVKVDIWGLGCVLYALTSYNPPFEGANLITLGMNIVSASPKPIPSCYSKKLETLIFQCLAKNPDERPSLENLANTCTFSSRLSRGNTLPSSLLGKFSEATPRLQKKLPGRSIGTSHTRKQSFLNLRIPTTSISQIRFPSKKYLSILSISPESSQV